MSIRAPSRSTVIGAGLTVAAVLCLFPPRLRKELSPVPRGFLAADTSTTSVESGWTSINGGPKVADSWRTVSTRLDLSRLLVELMFLGFVTSAVAVFVTGRQ